MSIAEQLEKLAARKTHAPSAESGEDSQLKDLEEVEAILKEIGVSLEPRFDISLAARIGAAASKG